MHKLRYFIFFLATLAGVTAQELKSPNGNFSLVFELQQTVPTYSLSLNGETILNKSKLGF